MVYLSAAPRYFFFLVRASPVPSAEERKKENIQPKRGMGVGTRTVPPHLHESRILEGRSGTQGNGSGERIATRRGAGQGFTLTPGIFFSSVTINPRACRRTARELRHMPWGATSLDAAADPTAPHSCFASLLPLHWLLLTAIAVAPIAIVILGVASRYLPRSTPEHEASITEASARHVQMVQTLENAQQVEARIRLRVSVCTFALGWVLYVFCDDVFAHMCMLVDPSASLPDQIIAAPAVAPILVLISCRPTDRVAIRCGAIFLVVPNLYRAVVGLNDVLGGELSVARAANWDQCASYRFSVVTTRAVLAICHSLFYVSSMRLSERLALKRLWLGLRCHYVINVLFRLLPKYALAVLFGCSSDGDPPPPVSPCPPSPEHSSSPYFPPAQARTTPCERSRTSTASAFSSPYPSPPGIAARSKTC